MTSTRVTLTALARHAMPLAVPLAILLLALTPRLYGLDWDDGYLYTPHPDERAILSKVDEISPPTLGNLTSLFDADESPWNPRWFPYGSFPLYALKGVQLTYTEVSGRELTDLRLVGRTISALADVAAVMMVYVLGSRVYGRRAGILASLLAALAVIHIQLSHFFAVDTLLSLFTVVSIFFMYRVAERGRPRDSILAGAFVGLGMATKVSLAPIYGALLMAHLMYAFGALSPGEGDTRYRWRLSAGNLVVGLAASVLVLFIVQPYAFLDSHRFFGDVIEQSEMVRRIRDYPYTRQYIDTTPYWHHVRQLATWGLGWPLGVVAWAGLLYASVRGLRLRSALVYLLLGWVLPMAMLLASTHLISIIAALAIAVLALFATLPFRPVASRVDVLMLSWVTPYLLLIGSFDVKFLRYLVPVTPFLILFGSRLIFDLWDGASRFRPALRPLVGAGVVLLVGTTGLYAFSYLSVYAEPHTAVRASQWLNENAPPGSVVLREHWEEALPDLSAFRNETLDLYDPDTPHKVRLLASALSTGDYLVHFSNRLYGTIPRLPDRYPFSREYYRLLFDGGLGYELVEFETSYPGLLGVSLVDETFARPGLPEPAPLRAFEPSAVTLDLGFADESFSVYDHPKVMVFQNLRRHDAETIRRTIMDAAPAQPPGDLDDGQTVGLLMSPEDAAAQQAGGTLSSIVRPGSWTSRLPVLAWLLLTEGIALLTLPIAMVVFRPLPDRGFLFSKILGLLLVGFLVWLLASLHWMAFSRASISVALLGLALVSALVVARRRGEIQAFLRQRWPLLLIGEAIFLAAFFIFLALRMANPDLWHPFRGGEKPMDLAYLNAVLRSTYMPPYDPWFAGGYINYYYWGQFIVAMLVKATGINPDVAYNLAVPTFFALTVAGAFAVVYNLAEGALGWLRPSGVTSDGSLPGREPGLPRGAPGPPAPAARSWSLRWSPVAAGLGGALMVTVLGNLDGAIQVVQGAWRATFLGRAFGEFDFWRSSRMMAPDPPGHEITEFPFFSFLFADLHAHMMALPFTLLVLGLAIAVVMGAAPKVRGLPRWLGASEFARFALLGLAIGSLWVLNAWDFPTYLIIGLAAVTLAELYAHGGLGIAVVAKAGLKSLFVFGVGYVAFLPFHLSYEAFFTFVEPTTNTTVLWQFLAISGLFVFIIGSFFLVESWRWLEQVWSQVWRRWLAARSLVSGEDAATADDTRASQYGLPLVAGLLVVALLVGFVLAAAFAGVFGSTAPFVAALLVLVLVAGLRLASTARPDGRYLAFVTLIVSVSLMLVLGLDIFRVEGDIDRMNSVFKFYLQVWVLLAVASAYLLWRLALTHGTSLKRLGPGKATWLTALAVLVVASAVYPVLGSQDRVRDRFNGRTLPLTLDGTAYVEEAVYHDRQGDIDLDADFEGITWLRENVQGSPVVLEGVTPTYRWGGRISIYTGLPAVVGWQWHQQQQRWDYRTAVDRRIADVGTIYRTPDPSVALTLLRRYGVTYVYVGQLERLYYPESGLAKFDRGLDGQLERVWESPHVTIYRLRDDSR